IQYLGRKAEKDHPMAEYPWSGDLRPSRRITDIVYIIRPVVSLYTIKDNLLSHFQITLFSGCSRILCQSFGYEKIAINIARTGKGSAFPAVMVIPEIIILRFKFHDKIYRLFTYFQIAW